MSASDVDTQKMKAKEAMKDRIAASRSKYVSPEWTSPLSKPKIDKDVWGNETSDDLAAYIDWHARHPHCSTPRKLTDDDRIAAPGGSATIAAYDDVDDSESRVRGRGTSMIVDNDNPTLVYSNTGIMPTPIDPLFVAQEEGADGEISVISKKAERLEYEQYCINFTEYDDPWYNKSVRDSLEESHYDGFHTPNSNGGASVVSAFSKKSLAAKSVTASPSSNSKPYKFHSKSPVILKVEPAVSYTPPDLQTAILLNKEHFNKAAVVEAAGSLNAEVKRKIGPWDEQRVWSQLTVNGTEQLAWQQIKLERDVHASLLLYDKTLYVDEIVGRVSKKKPSAASMIASPCSSEKLIVTTVSSMKSYDSEMKDGIDRQQQHSLVHLTDITEAAAADVVVGDEALQAHDSDAVDSRRVGNKDSKALTYDQQVELIRTIIGDTKIDRMKHEWVTYAETVRQQTKKSTKWFDFSIDFTDACESGDYKKVLALLAAGHGSVAATIDNDTPIFYHVFNKVLVLDSITNSINVGDKVGPDSNKYMLTLEVLVKFDADINAFNIDGYAPIHLATLNRNARLMTWLLGKGADVNLVSKCDRYTALMYAASAGYVNMLGALLLKNARIDQYDTEGNTALHHAATKGQTQASCFLLKLGANKTIVNRKRVTAIDIATNLGFNTCALLMATTTKIPISNRTQLEYMYEKYYPSKTATAYDSIINVIGGAISGITSLFASPSKKKGVVPL